MRSPFASALLMSLLTEEAGAAPPGENVSSGPGAGPGAGPGGEGGAGGGGGLPSNSLHQTRADEHQQPSWPPPPTSPLHAYFKPPPSPGEAAVTPAEADEEFIRKISLAAMGGSSAASLFLSRGGGQGSGRKEIEGERGGGSERNGPAKSATASTFHIPTDAAQAPTAIIQALNATVQAPTAELSSPFANIDLVLGISGNHDPGTTSSMGERSSDDARVADDGGPYGRAISTASLALGLHQD